MPVLAQKGRCCIANTKERERTCTVCLAQRTEFSNRITSKQIYFFWVIEKGGARSQVSQWLFCDWRLQPVRFGSVCVTGGFPLLGHATKIWGLPLLAQYCGFNIKNGTSFLCLDSGEQQHVHCSHHTRICMQGREMYVTCEATERY